MAREQEAKLPALRRALVEGEESGSATEFDFDAFIARKKKKPARAYLRFPQKR